MVDHDPKRVYRLYRDMGLQLRNKTPKRRVKAKLRNDRRPATRSNETWAMDFVYDQLATGRKLRVLTIVDTFSRFSPAEPRFNFRGADVVDILEEVGREVGFPVMIRADQGTELVSRDLDLWAYQRGFTLDFSRQRDRQQSSDRAHRSISRARPALSETAWKKSSRPVQGWGAVHSARRIAKEFGHDRTSQWGRPNPTRNGSEFEVGLSMRTKLVDGI